MNIVAITEELPASKTHAFRDFSFVALPGARPILTVRAGKTKERIKEIDTYDVEEDDTPGRRETPGRTWFLCNRESGEVYATSLLPSGPHCTCAGHVAGGHTCKHIECVKRVDARAGFDGGLDAGEEYPWPPIADIEDYERHLDDLNECSEANWPLENRLEDYMRLEDY